MKKTILTERSGGLDYSPNKGPAGLQGMPIGMQVEKFMSTR